MKTQDVDAGLLIKLGWKVLTNPDNILVKVVFAKHLKNVGSFEAKKVNNAFIMSKYILDNRYLLKKHMLDP